MSACTVRLDTPGQAEHFSDNHYRMRYFPTIELRGSKCTPEWYLLQAEMEVSFKDDGDNVTGRPWAICLTRASRTWLGLL